MSDMDGWIKHDGGPCPVPPEVFVQVKSGITGDIRIRPDVLKADQFYWPHVLEYRIFIPAHTAAPGSSEFVRETAARIMAADYWKIARDDEDMAKAAVAAAIALEKALQEAGE